MEKEARIIEGNKKLKEIFKWARHENDRLLEKKKIDGTFETGLDGNKDIQSKVDKELWEKIEQLKIEYADVASEIRLDYQKV